MSTTQITRDGTVWVPEYVESIDPEKCIACGRCYKVCSRKVLDLVDRTEIMECDDDDDDDSESMMSVMIVAHAGDCIGCGACGRVCPKGCYTYAAAA